MCPGPLQIASIAFRAQAHMYTVHFPILGVCGCQSIKESYAWLCTHQRGMCVCVCVMQVLTRPPRTHRPPTTPVLHPLTTPVLQPTLTLQHPLRLLWWLDTGTTDTSTSTVSGQ